jgi:hypothetical protein
MSVRITVTAPTIATITAPTSTLTAQLTATAPVVIARIPSNYGLITFSAVVPSAAEIKVS